MQHLHIFGRDIAQIPCFRNSFLYGIGGGVGAGFLTFMGTSRPKLSSHTAFGTFFAVTFVYWFSCRYTFSKKKFEYNQLQVAMKRQAIYEGTSMETEANRQQEAK